MNAQVPFEKKGKWGLLDASNNKVIVKPEYSSISPIQSTNLFLISKKTNSGLRGEHIDYGVIDSLGKKIIPLKADSITYVNDKFLVHCVIYKQINETKYQPYQYTELYNRNGDLIKGLYGYIETAYPAGYIFMAWDDQDGTLSRRKSPSHYLLDQNLNKVYDNPIKVLESGTSFLIIKESNSTHIIRTNTFEEMGTISGNNNGYEKLATNMLLIQNGEYYGYLNLASGDIMLPKYSKMRDGSNCVLYTKENKEAISIDPNGNFTSGKIYHNYTGKYEFVPQSADGSFCISESICEDVRPIGDSHKYSVMKDNKWGVYDAYSNELIIPFVLPSPISKILRQEYAVIKVNDAYSLYDKSGKLLLTTDGKIDDVVDGLVYIYDYWVPKAIYSISSDKWIVPSGKYLSVRRLTGGNFAVETSKNTYNILSESGKVLNTITNVSDFNNWLDDVVGVVTTAGKLGLINKSTAQWVAQPVYENDIAWGSGTGLNRRIALAKKNNSGEQVVVMTLSGKIIASQNFPYGTKKSVIKNFGKKYLYQSY